MKINRAEQALELAQEVMDEYNKLPEEERKKINRYITAYKIKVIEQIKKMMYAKLITLDLELEDVQSNTANFIKRQYSQKV